MQRRRFIHSLSATALAPALALGRYGQVFAAGADQPRFLLVFLRGGYDAAHLLVPIASPFYYESRPGIAIAPPSGDEASALPLDSHWGLHPALRDTVYPLYQKGQASFVPFAGTQDTSRSHFETQDSIELGQPLTHNRDYRSGFLNRLCATLQGTPLAADPMAFTRQLPISMQGSVLVPNTALDSVARPAVDARQSAIIAGMYGGSNLAPNVREGFAVRDEVMHEMASQAMRDKSEEMTAASRNAINTKGFGQQARRIAGLMRERYNIGFVDVGGWDTHVGQGGAHGYLASRFDELGRGLVAYAQEMGPQWRNTTVVVLSEFGRTFRQNGNGGTDHGHGSVHWVLGGSLRGGKVVGEQVAVQASTLFQNRDFPVLNDYRAVLAGIFARQFGLSPAQNQQVFAQVTPTDIGLL